MQLPTTGFNKTEKPHNHYQAAPLRLMMIAKKMTKLIFGLLVSSSLDDDVVFDKDGIPFKKTQSTPRCGQPNQLKMIPLLESTIGVPGFYYGFRWRLCCCKPVFFFALSVHVYRIHCRTTYLLPCGFGVYSAPRLSATSKARSE